MMLSIVSSNFGGAAAKTPAAQMKRRARSVAFMRLAMICGNSLEAFRHQQRIEDRIASAECAVHRRRVQRSAARQHHVAEALSVLALQTAVLLEPCPRVFVDDVAPEIRVIAGGVAVGPDV